LVSEGLVTRVPLAPTRSAKRPERDSRETQLPVSDGAEAGRRWVIDPALVDAARTGDEEALRRLLSQSYPLVRRWTSAHGADPSEVEDVTQDVMVAVVRKLPSFRGESRFTSWLYRVCRNAWIDRTKAQQRRERLAAPLESVESTSEGQPAPHLENPAAVLEQKAMREQIIRAFGALSARQREVLDLSDMQGFNSQEIAEMLGVKASTVRVTLLNARRALRLRLLQLDPDLAQEFGHEL
jgi:RNA polymerase sigma-70 factor (ECF subfamily)